MKLYHYSQKIELSNDDKKEKYGVKKTYNHNGYKYAWCDKVKPLTLYSGFTTNTVVKKDVFIQYGNGVYKGKYKIDELPYKIRQEVTKDKI